MLLVNLDATPLTVTHGMRIARMVMAAVARALFCDVNLSSGSARGFGSTGRH